MLESEKNGHNSSCRLFILIWGSCDVINVSCDKMIPSRFIHENHSFACHNPSSLSQGHAVSEDLLFFKQPFYQCLGFKMPIKDDLFLLLDVFCSRVAGILSMKITQELCGVSEKERCNAALCPRSWKVNSVESARWSRAFNRDNLLVEDYTKSKSNW